MRFQLLVAASLLTAGAAMAQEPVVALRNATVETLSAAGRIDGATVVIRAGKIEAVGKDVKIPDDATVIDAQGGTLIPGIIDPHYEIVVAGAVVDDGEPPAARGGGRGGRAERPAPAGRGGFTRVADNFYPHDSAYKPLPRAGVTRLNLITNGIGQAAVVRVTPSQPERMLVQADGVAYVSVTNSSDSLDEIRTRLEAAATGRPRAGGRGGAGGARGGRSGRGGAAGGRGGAPTDADATLWQQVHDGQTQLIATASTPAAVIQLMRALEPYQNVKLVLYTGGDSAHETVDVLKGRKVCVVLRPTIDLAPNSRDRFNAARLLHEAGVEFAFSIAARTGGGGGAGAGAAGDAEPPAAPSIADQDFPLFPVAMLVKTGLPRTAALEALTKRPAAILGLDKTHGTIEPGKAADLLLYTGDPLDFNSRLRLTLIDGRTAYAN